jgi:hypothetical protein
MAATYEPIASVTLGSAATGITFSSIPSTYTDLVLVLNMISTTANNDVRLRVNGDSATNYSSTYLAGNGSAASSGRGAVTTSISALYLAGTSTGLNTFVYQFQSYANSNVFKTVLLSSAVSDKEIVRVVGLWRSTTAINEVYVFEAGNNSPTTFAVNTVASLYGIKSA